MLCIYKNVLSGWRDGSFSKMYGGLNLIPGTHKMRPGAIRQPCSLSSRRRHRQADPWGSLATSLDYVMSCSPMRHNFSKTKVETTHRMKPKVDLCPPHHTQAHNYFYPSCTLTNTNRHLVIHMDSHILKYCFSRYHLTWFSQLTCKVGGIFLIFLWRNQK